MAEYRVSAFVVDKDKVLFYKEDGDTFIIKQGDPRLQEILDKIVPINARGEVAVVDFDQFTVNVYKEFEKKSSIVKFFKIARKKLTELFSNDDDVETVELSAKPSEVLSEPKKEVSEPVPMNTPYAPSDIAPVKSTTKIDPAYEKIKNNSKPEQIKQSLSVADDFAMPLEETIIAIIGDTVIPDIEKIRPYIQHALQTESQIGVENFLKRISTVIKKRSHSIADLMRFMERGDLPIADDGSIIAYKKLYKQGDHYVDPHTKKVTQKVGSYVCVDENLVDPNRNNECSNGLHIGQRSYMRSFSGDTIMLVKLAPEDVITVPERDASKIRAMGYHILGVVPAAAYGRINLNRSMIDGEDGAQRLLARAIKGDHVPRLEEVRIHGQKGKNVVITPLVDGKPAKVEKPVLTESDKKKAKSIPEKEAEEKLSAKKINPRDINKNVNKEINKAKSEPVEETETKAQRDARRKREKRALDKANKSGTSVSKTNKKTNTNTEKKTSKNPVKNEKKSEPVNKLIVNTNDDIDNMIIIMGDKNHTDDYRQRAAQAILDFKRKKKVGWDRLNIPNNIVNIINELTKK